MSTQNFSNEVWAEVSADTTGTNTVQLTKNGMANIGSTIPGLTEFVMFDDGFWDSYIAHATVAKYMPICNVDIDSKPAGMTDDVRF